MANDTLTEAITLIKAGKKAEARKLLEPFIEANPHNIQAWIWEAETWPTAQGKIKVLELCLQHNPENGMIRQALATAKLQVPSKPIVSGESPASSDKQTAKINEEVEFYSKYGVKVTSQYLIVPPHTWPISLFQPVRPEHSGGKHFVRLLDRNNGQQVHQIESDNAERIQLIAEAINHALGVSSMPMTISAQAFNAAYDRVQPVMVVNFNMPFWALVGFIIKVSLASIPAMIILAIVMAVIWGLIGGILLAMLSSFR